MILNTPHLIVGADKLAQYLVAQNIPFTFMGSDGKQFKFNVATLRSTDAKFVALSRWAARERVTIQVSFR